MEILKSYSKGMLLHYEGDVSSKLYYLVSGSCKAYKVSRDSEVFLYELTGGCFISDFTLDGACALSTVEFSSDSVVACIDFNEAKEKCVRILSGSELC